MESIGELHFSVHVEGLVPMIRQAYHLENHKEWAMDTLEALGLETEEQKLAVLNGDAGLISCPDGVHIELVEGEDTDWKAELEKHHQFIDSTTYVLGGRRLQRASVDRYTNDIVGRLRNAMKMRFANTGDSIKELVELEQARRDAHIALFIEAGFTRKEAERKMGEEQSEAFMEFDDALSEHVDKAVPLFTKGYEQEVK